MTRTERPKVENPFNHKVTVKFNEEEHQIMDKNFDIIDQDFLVENVQAKIIVW